MMKDDYSSHSAKQDLRDDLNELQRTLQRRDAEIAHIKGKLTNVEDENAQLTEDIRLLQEKSFKSMTGARWAPMDQGAVTGGVENIRDAIWRLSREHAVSSLEELQRQPEKIPSELRYSLQTVVQFAEKGSAAILELAGIQKAAGLCLAALISHTVHKDIIANPFFFMDDGVSFSDWNTKFPEVPYRLSALQVLQNIYVEGSTCEYRWSELISSFG